jgi:hypothetical protein
VQACRQDAGATRGAENVGAPTFKVLLEGFCKEIVFRIIGDLILASFQNGTALAGLTP